MSSPRRFMSPPVLGLLSIGLAGCGEVTWHDVAVTPTVEDRTPEGDLYTPSTQSFSNKGRPAHRFPIYAGNTV